MLIHLQSDTHIEMGGSINDGMVCSDVTVCAGDIGKINNLLALERYFDKVKENTDHVIWVLGNHEFYDYKYKKGLEDAKAFADRHGIHLLDEFLGTENLEIDGVKFWGSTLWTDVKKGDYFAKKSIDNGFNDFYVIENDLQFAERRFHVQDSIDINDRTRDKINWDADVIITHHCPIMIPNPRFDVTNTTYGFHNTGLEEQIANCKVKYWLYGHTHHTTSVDVNGTLVISNQHGYATPNWTEESDFDPYFIIEI